MGYVLVGSDRWYYVATTESGWTMWSPHRNLAWVAPDADAARDVARKLVQSEPYAVRAYAACDRFDSAIAFTMRPAMVLA